MPKERTRTVGDRLEVREAGMAGANIRRRGEDFFSGEPLLGAGAPLTAEIIGLLAAAGARRIRSARRPTLHLVPTGSEFLAPAPTRQAIRYDSNTPMIEALCAEMRLQCRSRDPVPDDADMLKEAISKEMASDADVLVSIGGSSVGAHDHILDVLTGLGARMVFHGIAMRPGKPLLFAMLPDGRPFFGLPGNPVAALIGFRIFVLAAAQAMEGRDSETAVAVVPTGLGREGITLFQAANFDAAAGRVDIIPGQRPHLLRPLTKADGWALVEMHEGVEQSSYFPRLPAL